MNYTFIIHRNETQTKINEAKIVLRIVLMKFFSPLLLCLLNKRLLIYFRVAPLQRASSGNSRINHISLINMLVFSLINKKHL